MTLVEALRYHASLMIAPEVAPKVRALLNDASTVMWAAAEALSTESETAACSAVRPDGAKCSLPTGHSGVHDTVAPSAVERRIQVHEHDCPTAWTFFNKHGLGSKLPPSCLVCGKVEEDREKWAIKHLELPNIYVCAGCVAQSATEAIFPLLWHINDHLHITPDEGVEYTGSTNDVDEFRNALHKLDPTFQRGTVERVPCNRCGGLGYIQMTDGLGKGTRMPCGCVNKNTPDRTAREK
jgi:hypothetical protein